MIGMSHRFATFKLQASIYQKDGYQITAMPHTSFINQGRVH